MTLVPKTAMPDANPSELKALSDSLAATIKNRENILLNCEMASVDIHKRQLAKYKAQKSEVDAKLSSLNPTQSK